MAEHFFSLCCCSCFGLLSSSQEDISSSLLPHEHSTTSSPSQPSEQEAIAGPSTANLTDFKNFLQKFNDISQIDGLIQVSEELLKIASGEESDEGSDSAKRSYIQDGQKILEMLDSRIGKCPETENSRDDAIAEIEKVFIEVLDGAEKIHTLGMALSMLGSVLARSSQMFDNESECLEVLRRMLNLGKQILGLNEQNPEQKEKLNEGVQCIVVGSSMCISQLARANVFRFLTATVNAESLKDFQVKIDHLYSDIQSLIQLEIVKRMSKNTPESQKLYAYQPAVGIESARESVIKLLDLNAQDAVSIVVVIYGFGGIGKTTLADAAYARIDLQSYKHCRIHMDQDCTKNDLQGLQQQILKDLFSENLQLKNCDEGRGILQSFLQESPNQPLFLYIDNALKSTDLEQLLPQGFGSCLPPKSRILVTTRNLHQMDIFVSRNIQSRKYVVSPVPETEARKILLEKVSEYNDENNIQKLLTMCGGVPLLLQLAGSQLAINPGNTKSMVSEMLQEGKEVKERDLSDRMVGFVYDRLLEPVQEAFLDITSYFCNWSSKYVARIVGEEEFRALEAASFIRTSKGGSVIVHDIVRARGKRLSEENIIKDPETLLECLKDEEKLKNLKGIFLIEDYSQPSIEINLDHLNYMSNSLRMLFYQGLEITFKEKCHKPFEQLKYLVIPHYVPDLPMEFEKLEHLFWYSGPLTEGMNLYEFPASLRTMDVHGSSENRAAYSRIPPKVTPASLLVQLSLYGFKNMQSLPDGVEKLTKLEHLSLKDCHQLKELPSKLIDLSNLIGLEISGYNKLKELPSDFGQLGNLTCSTIWKC
ncbi:hypothetical protein SUGI_0952970 [Cryptomeria japonica]|uniref:disease resistance protein RPV1 isoform X2 n=1 Tax=Cryptomeria japonica TaxID=3369 RepID=UPI0024149131|nr:disease resistance protein RPV1 isoform X2 [Cryptomeria japonica]GLJ45277.1 hypothetical protein SUGI_0952970 [Cryptomeria japonica]